jgi:protein-tyrosine phosphatase
MDKVSEYTFISNWNASNDMNLILGNGIKGVITIERTPKPLSILRQYYMNGVNFLQVFLEDRPTANLGAHLDRTYQFIDSHVSNQQSVLVHCAMGISRSAAVLVDYMVRKAYETNALCASRYWGNGGGGNISIVDQFIRKMKNVRPIVNPNPGFIRTLKNRERYYKSLQIENSM